jgi:hypothetical protein
VHGAGRDRFAPEQADEDDDDFIPLDWFDRSWKSPDEHEQTPQEGLS